VERESCTFLGYADATLVVPSAFGKELDLKIRIYGIQVKLLNGRPRMDLPQEQGADGKWYSVVRPANGETRKALTDALFADRMVNAVAVTVQQDRDRAAS
jgi:hypothetical protein